MVFACLTVIKMLTGGTKWIAERMKVKATFILG
jgi:hypothetical protein